MIHDALSPLSRSSLRERVSSSASLQDKIAKLRPTSREELQAHRAKHVAIQQTLRRRGGRTYGARLEDADAATISPSDSSTQPSILPLFNIPTAQASGSPEAQPSTTPSTAGNARASARKTGSAGNGSVDMEFHCSLAELMRHDSSYLFFRQFSLLNVQNLLWMQSELAELETLLAGMRGVDAGYNPVAEEEAAGLRTLIREKLQLYSAWTLDVHVCVPRS